MIDATPHDSAASNDTCRLEDALDQAIRLEAEIGQVYRRLQAGVASAAARRVFEILASEEDDHLAYLEARRDELRRQGRIDATEPPECRWQRPTRRQLEEQACLAATEDRDGEIAALEQAERLERTAIELYERLARHLPLEQAALFQGFLEREKVHLDLVQAELDAVSGQGFWFELQEFDLERE